jgi:hypothetical protein
MRRIKLLASIGFTIFCGDAYAQVVTSVYGYGNHSGGAYLSIASGHKYGSANLIRYADGTEFYDKAYMQSEWISGYLSAINALHQNPKQIDIDTAAVDLWLRQWCNLHPASTMMQAIDAFIVEQMKTP